ncbi:predicted protein [Nematostella vectensis]|uniref:Uncharacterized protein n=1 Tax=Nematostella vectensis TaxID=45351 RepID=A7SP55_NEMVE|nr:predicted protein [Nematostella vectensis]|eukprot:XP_001626616.1 predicted protein [Nematostella vectensis]
MAKSLPTTQPLEMQGDMATNWEKFKDSWENYIIATELNKKLDAIVVATLLTVMGKDCCRIYKNLPLTDHERKSPTSILEKLGEEFQSKSNIIYERASVKDTWENYIIATGLNKKLDAIVVATLLTVMGKDCYRIYNNLPLTDHERKSPTSILEKLGEEFQSKRNIIYERYLYFCIAQEPSKGFDRFLNSLRDRITTCKYITLENEMLRDRIVFGVNNSDTRERLLGKN